MIRDNKRLISICIFVNDSPIACKAKNWGYLENWKSTASVIG